MTSRSPSRRFPPAGRVRKTAPPRAALVVRLATRHKKVSLATVAVMVLAGGFYGLYRALAGPRRHR